MGQQEGWPVEWLWGVGGGWGELHRGGDYLNYKSCEAWS